MIEFIEKERYYDDSIFTGQCWMYPMFMVKDGIEYFMWNRREPDDSWKLKEREGQKAELFANDGAYFHFHGIYADPFEMLTEMEGCPLKNLVKVLLISSWFTPSSTARQQ